MARVVIHRVTNSLHRNSTISNQMEPLPCHGERDQLLDSGKFIRNDNIQFLKKSFDWHEIGLDFHWNQYYYSSGMIETQAINYENVQMKLKWKNGVR